MQLRAIAELERRRRQAASGGSSVGLRFSQYQEDPVGFGCEILGETYTDDVIAMMRSVVENPVTIAKSANAVGKTHGAARVAVWFYKVFSEIADTEVYTAAAPPESNLRRLLWGEIGTLIHKHPTLFSRDRVQSLHVSSGPKRFLTGVTIPVAGRPELRQAKFSGKHADYILFIVDEGDAVPLEVYKGIESCMSGGHARLLIMFNPRAQSGPVWQMERDRRANIVHLSAFGHPNVISGQDLISGAVTRDITVNRINKWSRPLAGEELPDIECFEVPDFLVGAQAVGEDGTLYPPLPAGWRKIENPDLFVMTLGQYPPQSEQQLISRAWIDAAVARWHTYVAQYGEVPPSQVKPIQGQDVAEFGKDKNVSIFRYGGWVAQPHTWSGVDPDFTAIRAAGLYKQYFARIAFVDATGVGAGVAPRMVRLEAENAYGVKVATSPTYKPEIQMAEFNTLRDQLWWSVREWLRTDPGAMLPPCEPLLEELSIPTYVIYGGKVRVMDKDMMRSLLGRSPDYADALCLTFAPEETDRAEYGEFEFSSYRG